MNWYDISFLRRKELFVKGSEDGAQTNYQVKLTIFKGTGQSVISSYIYIEDVKDDFSDIRFTSSDGVTLLKYWTESITSGISAVVWVKLDSLLEYPYYNKFYLYYNNDSATSESDGTNTFNFFDDCSSDWRTDLWGAEPDGVYYNKNNYIDVRGYAAGLNDGVLTSVGIFDYNSAIRWKGYTTTSEPSKLSYGGYRSSDSEQSILLESIYGSNYYQLYTSIDSVGSISTTDAVAGMEYIHNVCRYHDAVVINFNDGDNHYFNSYVPMMSLPIYFSAASYVSGFADTIIYWVLVRNYTLNEPEIKYCGEEETNIETKVSWYDAHYRKRKKITILGTEDGEQINYQMFLVLAKDNLTDRDNIIFLGNDVKDDFSDVRFTKSDGITLLNYFVADLYVGDGVIVWLKFDSISSFPSHNYFYIYYNNEDAVSASNGIDTFIFFDDFDSYDPSKWSVVGSVEFSNSNIHFLGSGEDNISSYSTFPLNRRFISKAKTEDDGVNLIRITSSNNETAINYFSSDNPYDFYAWAGQWSPWQSVMISTGYARDNDYHTFELVRDGTIGIGYDSYVTFVMDYNNNQVSLYEDLPTGNVQFWFRRWYGNASAYCDWMAVANFTHNEPTFGMYGSEEVYFLGAAIINEGMLVGEPTDFYFDVRATENIVDTKIKSRYMKRITQGVVSIIDDAHRWQAHVINKIVMVVSHIIGGKNA
jgi:hypothetical protein